MRKRVRTPGPHDLEQGVRSLHVDVLQCIGHGPESHACVTVSAGQAMPPCRGRRRTTRRCVAYPPPHEEEHDPISKRDTRQFTGSGHSKSLHVRVCSSAGHGLPSNIAFTFTVRVRLSTPAPHVRSQPPQTLQWVTAQWTGQGWVLQRLISLWLGHFLPPAEA